MPLPDASWLTILFGAIKAAGEAVKAVWPGKSKREVGTESLPPLSVARQVELQKEVLRLQEENSQLLRQQSAAEQRAREREEYQLTQVGAATVLARRDDPSGAFFCPTCFEVHGVAVPLQPHIARYGSFGSHMCPKCKSSYRLVERGRRR